MILSRTRPPFRWPPLPDESGAADAQADQTPPPSLRPKHLADEDAPRRFVCPASSLSRPSWLAAEPRRLPENLPGTSSLSPAGAVKCSATSYPPPHLPANSHQ